MSIIFITHDLGVIADICDRVAVMPETLLKLEPLMKFSIHRNILILEDY